jgi:hypothetical protein
MTDREAFEAFIKDSEYIHVSSALAAWNAATSIERERAARVCDDLVLDHPGRADLTAKQCADKIRSGS